MNLDGLGPGAVALLGVPCDENSSFLRGSAAAPAVIRSALFDPEANLGTEDGRSLAGEARFVDAGDMCLPPGTGENGEAVFASIVEQAGVVLARGARVLALGGDHSVSFPLVRAHAAHRDPFAIVQIDAHPDLYDDFEGNRFSHASPFARIMEERLATRLVQVGIRAPTPHQREQAERFGVETVEVGIGRPAAKDLPDGPVYLSVDLDGLDPAFAPGAAHLEPGGLSPREVIEIVHDLPGELIGADIVELNPRRDIHGMTALLAAKLVKEIAARLLRDASVLLTIAALGGVPGCGRETAAPVASPPDGHARMIAMLARVEAAAADENQIIGDRQARVLRTRLARMPPNAPRAEVISLRVGLGNEELRLGNYHRAIEHLVVARTLLEELDSAGRLRRPELLFNASYMLAIAHLRRGETENCCERYTPESCLLPIRGRGVHTRPEGSREAITWLTEVLDTAPPGTPLFLKAKWLLNIAAMTVGAYPDDVPPPYRIDPDVYESREPFPRFTNIAPGLGLAAFDLAGSVVADDFDGDGCLDLLVSAWDSSRPLKLHLNNRDGTFRDRSEEANLAGLLGGFNLVPADYDNDGDLDVLVLRGAWIGRAGRIPNSLLRNDGHGRFTDVTFEAGLGAVHWPTQTAAWADFDNDGNLDVYIGNELHQDLVSPGQLFRNDGDGTFTDVATAAGVLNHGLAKSVAWGDYDGDGFADLYVSNLGQANRLYRNEGDGTFVDVAPALGVDGPRMSFPAWFWDFDNDGALDLFVASYEWTDGNLAAVVASRLGEPMPFDLARLYRGDGRGGFTDVAVEQGLTDLSLPMGANFGDLDNDGFLDFYLGTGYPDYEGLMPNVMYVNRGGAGFVDVSSAGGFGHLQKGHGIAFADLDNDGDQDVFEQMGGFFPGDKFGNALYENPGFGTHWITVHLVGVRSNRSAIGARLRVVVVEEGRPRAIYRHVGTGGSFGANPLRQTIGLGRGTSIEVLEVRWPATGQEQVFHNPPVDRFIRIVEGEDEYTVVDLPTFRLGQEK